MFEIKVSNFYQAPELKHTWANKVISLLDPGVEFAKGFAGDENHLIEYFHDIYGELEGWVHPEKFHLESVLKFSSKFQDTDKILIHCHQGVSRSTATAIAVSCQHGILPKAAVESIFAIRDCMWPNATMIMLYDDILELNGELTKEVVAWRKNRNRFDVVSKPTVDQKQVDDMNKWKNLFK